MDMNQIFTKMQPGPFTGMGSNGRGNPFGGIVEDTNVFWVRWLIDAARTAGVDLAGLSVAFAGVPLRLDAVRVGFGTRHYWLCPECGGKCEAIYRQGRRVGCRRCLHLGYRSQISRITSRWFWLNRMFDESLNRILSSRTAPDDFTAKAIAAAFRDKFEQHAQEQSAAILVEVGV